MARRPRRDRPRTKSGRLSRAYATSCRDLGTSELQAKRLAAVGPGNDPVLSATIAGRYWARGLIDQEQYVRALEVRQLYVSQFGPGWPSNAERGDPASEKYLLRCRRKLERIARALGREAFLLVRDFSVFDRPARREPLVAALDMIAAH
jgi:hypothetical protein